MFEKIKVLGWKLGLIIKDTLLNSWDVVSTVFRVFFAFPFWFLEALGSVSGVIANIIAGADMDYNKMGAYDGVNGYECSSHCPYKIWIPQDIWHKMHYLVKKCKYELGGHLEIEEKNNNIIVRGLHLPAQAVSSGSYSPSSKHFANVAKKNPQLLSKIKGWFHSHANHIVCWSHDDETTISNSLSVFKDFCLSVVVNKEGEYKIRLDVNDNGEVESYDNLPLHMLMGENKEMEKVITKVIQSNVKKEDFIDSLTSTYGGADGLF